MNKMPVVNYKEKERPDHLKGFKMERYILENGKCI